jgi:metal-responsive CopG/Arc/MetJ family transcriptional regulator
MRKETMARPQGAKNHHPTAEERMTVRMPKKLLQQLDRIAQYHQQNRSEAVLEALRDYVLKNREVDLRAQRKKKEMML